MPGPAANHPDARRRANKKPTAAELSAPAEPKGPELPQSYVLGVLPQTGGAVPREFSDATRRWWEKIRTAPQAGAYLEHHWEWLLLIAPLFDRAHALGDLDALKELRLQAPGFGLRPSDANSLDWKIDPKIVGPARTTEARGDHADEPPRSGAGSSTKAWRTYATEQLGLDVPKGAKRGEIQDLCDGHTKGRPSRRDPRLRVFDGVQTKAAADG